VRATVGPGSTSLYWVIRTKLAPPRASFSVIERTSLAVAASQAPQVTVVSAPAGFGKTTLMTQLRDQLRGEGVVTPWLSLDEMEATGKDFLSYLVVSCLEAGADLGPLAQMAESRFSGVLPHALCALLINGLMEDGRPTVLFLDDYHRVDSPEIAPLVRLLVAKAPRSVRFVIGSRTVPDLGLAALRARGDVKELSSVQLRFSGDEIERFFRGHGLRPDLGLIQEKTEGWAVALQLAVPYLQQAAEPGPLARFSGKSEQIADYLLEEVLSDLPEAEREFLTLTSLLERVNGDLANAITGRLDGWEMLERHHRRGLPMAALDRERTWFRYHHLLADLLAEKLLRRGPAAVEDVHRKAAAWLAQHGHLHEAVAHARLVPDPTFAADLLEAQGGWRLFLSIGVAGLRAFGGLQEVSPSAFPLTALAQAMLKAVDGQVQEARATFDAIRTRLEAEGRIGDVAVDLSDLDLTLQCYQDRPIAAERLAEADRLSRGPGVPAGMRAVSDNLVTISMTTAGDARGALARAAGLLETNRALEATYAELYLAIYLGLAHLRLGNVAAARELFEDIVRRARTRYGPDSNHAASGEIFLAWIDCLSGEYASAEALLGDKLQTIEYAEGTCDIVIAAFEAALSLGRRGGDAARQEELIERADMLGRMRDWGRLSELTAVWRTREHLLAGRPAAARSAASRRYPSSDQPGCSWDVRLEAALVLARLELEEGATASALSRLEPLEAELRRLGHSLLLSQALLIRAACLAGTGDPHGAASAVAEACGAAPAPIVANLLAGLGSRCASLLALAPSEVGASIARCDVRAGRPAGCDAAPPLTDREVEILLAMADGLSNKEMARRLDISESTVKFHRKNLYRKLGVSTRSRAISMARELGLMGSLA
jgi:LuxR family maltose regulon positive regulatory protein